jgi:hypothetical protein
MNTKTPNEIQFEKMEQAFDLIEVMQKAAEDLSVSFDELSNLIDIPHNRPEFADYTSSLDCKLTYFEPRNNTKWFELEENGLPNKPKEPQSFQVFDIVLFRPSISSEETVWLPLNNLPCSAGNVELVNNLFQQAWLHKTEVNTATLRQLVDFSKLNSDTSLEWRRCMRSQNNNTDNLAVKILDEIHILPKQIKIAQRKLSNLVEIINTIRPTNHLLNQEDLINHLHNQQVKQPREENNERSRGAITKAQRSNAFKPNQQPPAAN